VLIVFFGSFLWIPYQMAWYFRHCLQYKRKSKGKRKRRGP